MPSPLRNAVISGGLSLASLFAGCAKKPVAQAPVPMPVHVAEVVVRDQPVFTEFVGQTRGADTVAVTARVEGVLEKIAFTEGSFVKEGDLLYQIDARPLKAALAQAQAAVEQTEAAFETAQRDVERLRPIFTQGGISAQQFDEAQTKAKTLGANVLAARAALEASQLQLAYATIKAPISGLAGRNEVSVGNFVGRGQATVLTTVVALDPIKVRFSVSEQQYLSWARQKQTDEAKAKRGQGVFELVLTDGTVHPHKGSIVFADNQVDPATGTLMIEVSFPNPELTLRSGQFGRVRFPIDRIPGAVLVPQRAVMERQATYSVVVAKNDNTAEFRPVEVGARVGTLWIIKSGLKAGEKIIVDGIQKVGPGSSIVPTTVQVE